MRTVIFDSSVVASRSNDRVIEKANEIAGLSLTFAKYIEYQDSPFRSRHRWHAEFEAVPAMFDGKACTLPGSAILPHVTYGDESSRQARTLRNPTLRELRLAKRLYVDGMQRFGSHWNTLSLLQTVRILMERGAAADNLEQVDGDHEVVVWWDGQRGRVKVAALFDALRRRQGLMYPDLPTLHVPFLSSWFDDWASVPN